MTAHPSSSQQSVETTRTRSQRASPVYLALWIAVVAFAVEFGEPLFFGFLPPMSETTARLVDGIKMTVALAPFLYLLFIRPMAAQIDRREHAEQELRKLNDGLEDLVTERTNELISTNRQLTRLIDEQRSTAESLRRANQFVENVFERAPCLIFAFDAANRHCVYVNSRITDFLGYEQDDVAVINDDFVTRLVPGDERARFLRVLENVSKNLKDATGWGTCGFTSGVGRRVELAFGVAVLDRLPNQHAKNLLMTAMPTSG